jgi:tetratricopeptide (TPR) repeat protein
VRFRSSKKEAPVKSEDTNPLRQACREFDRIDLYEPLSWIITLRPQWAKGNLGAYFEDKRRYIVEANVMLYESKLNQAKEYFEKALRLAQPHSDTYHHLSVVLANLDVVSKIAQKSWELDSGSTVKSQPLLHRLASHQHRNIVLASPVSEHSMS